ncbi:MAG: hypothetical protein NTZ35_00890 [Ignavibacteriales bacterium]|nr:hypothetical protein [Ignavibacteriales bacterium]
MERSFKNSILRAGVRGALLLTVLLLFVMVPVESQQLNLKSLETMLTQAVVNTTGCKNVVVRVTAKPEKLGEIARIAIKLVGIAVGQLVVDNMTIVTDNPVIDLKKLRGENRLEFISYGSMKVSILASVRALEDYLQRKAAQFNKKDVHISLKFTPPYIECNYDVPKKEIASESVDLLKKFIPGDKIEGYAVFRIEAKDNGLYASSSKVITNHFLLPNMLLRLFESKFNPFDEISVVKPFSYRINNVTIQSNYVFMTN